MAKSVIGTFWRVYGNAFYWEKWRYASDRYLQERRRKAQRKLDLKQHQIDYKNRDHALYIAFAPYKEPRYSISVLIEHGGSGSKAAAPLASKLIKKIIDRHKLREQIIKTNIVKA